MSIIYYCGIKNKEDNFDPFNFKYDLLGYSKGCLNPNYWLLFDKDCESERGRCESSTKKCVETIEKTLNYIEEKTTSNTFSSNSLKVINQIKKFLIEKKEILKRFPDDNVVFDFSDNVWYSLKNCFNHEDLKGMEILTNKKRLVQLLNGKSNFALLKECTEKDIKKSIVNSLNELVKEINDTGIIYLEKRLLPDIISYPNNKNIIRGVFILENKTNSVCNDIDLLMSYVSPKLKKYNASYFQDWSMEIPEEYKNLNKEYHMIELSIMN